MQRRSLLVLLFAAMTLPSAIFAQSTQLPRAGRSFTFGIIEGPDNLLGDSAQSATTLTLTVVSPYDGCGIVLSPSGYEVDFSFSPGSPTIITLPYNLMLLHDLGWSNKGIIVKTTEPVNLVLHDYVADAGDASQILPDEALDTNYVAFGWGIYDDFLDPEHNNTEILVTAVDDSTQVTIIPNIDTRNGLKAGVPFTTTLNHGECYIVKADTSDNPSDPSLSGTQIHSTKPVSVICGLTCAYVPLGQESCNEFMDQIVGKKWWGSHFFVAPLGNADSVVEVVLTSDQNFFALINKGFVASTNNRVVAVLGGAAEIRTINSQSQPVAVEAHQIARGSSQSYYGISDPTLVTLLDTAYYSDTLIWNTPIFGGFQNWVPLIYPTKDYGAITLDGRPISGFGPFPSVINGSRYSSIVPPLNPGVHIIISPDPVFGLGTGFNLADAYSFIAGGVAGRVQHDTARHTIVLTADSATSCSDFEVAASFATPILDTEGVITLTVPITYDAATLHFVALVPGAMLTNARYTVDSSATGTVIMTVYGQPYVTGSDLFHVVFEGWKQISATIVGKNATVTGCGNYAEAITVQTVTFSIGPSTDTLQRTLALSNSPATVCQPVTIPLTADTILTPGDRFFLEKIEILYDTTTQTFLNWSPGPLMINTLNRGSGQTSGDFTILEQDPFPLTGSDTLLTLQLEPRTITANDTVRARVFYLRCSDTLERDITLIYRAGTELDTSRTRLAISTSSVSLGDQASADVTISGLPQNSNVYQFHLFLTYNHDVLTYEGADLSGTLTETWPQPTVSFGVTTDTLRFASLAALGGSPTPMILSHLLFKTFVADSSFSPISILSSLSGTVADCPTSFLSPTSSTIFLGKDLCGDTLLREFMLGKQLTLDRAEINSDGYLRVVLQSPISEIVDLSLTDMLGRVVWSGEITCPANGITDSELPIPAEIPSGALTLRAEAGGTVRSRKLVVLK